MVKIGQLPSGGDCIINRIAAEADLLLAEGFIESHFFAGFSGGRKSVLPGIASYKTIMANHSGEFIDSSNSRTGNLTDNPIHNDMVYAAAKANLAFIVNVVLDGDKKIIGSFAGDMVEAHKVGCNFVKEIARVKKIPCDIAVSTNGGFPLDQNIYQAVKGMTAAEATNKDGGVIIMVAGCRDGHGGEIELLQFPHHPKGVLGHAAGDALGRQIEQFIPHTLPHGLEAGKYGGQGLAHTGGRLNKQILLTRNAAVDRYCQLLLPLPVRIGKFQILNGLIPPQAVVV